MLISLWLAWGGLVLPGAVSSKVRSRLTLVESTGCSPLGFLVRVWYPEGCDVRSRDPLMPFESVLGKKPNPRGNMKPYLERGDVHIYDPDVKPSQPEEPHMTSATARATE